MVDLPIGVIQEVSVTIIQEVSVTNLRYTTLELSGLRGRTTDLR